MKIFKKLNFLLFAIVASSVISSCEPQKNPEPVPPQDSVTKIIVASDLHVFDSKLLEKPGSAFDQFFRASRNLLVESEPITDKLIEEILSEKPALFMICGDMTKDGELSSHNIVVQKLKKVQQAGIKVLVIPGNHDINNPHALKFNGDVSTPVDRVNVEQFRELYKDFGYDRTQTIEQGPELCYLVEPVAGLWVLGIDACIYKNNLQEKSPHVGGELDAVRIKWIVDKTKEGKAKGKQVIAMMHHGIIEHFPMQATAFSSHLIADYDNVARQLSEGGLEFIFTGHFHAQDIVKKEYPNGALYDIQTGSAATYPCPYRVVNLDKEKIDIKSHRIKLNSGVTGNIELEQYAYQHMKTITPGIADVLLKDLQKMLQIPDEMMAMIKTYAPQFYPVLLEMYTNHLKGDENGLSSNPDPKNPGNKELLEKLKEVIGQFAPQFAPYLNQIDPIFYDTNPKDNDLTIQITKK